MSLVTKVPRRLRTEWSRLRHYGPIDYTRLLKPRLDVWLRRDLMKQRFIVRKLHGYKILLDLHDNGISSVLAAVGIREADQIAILNRELTAGMTVMDIGSNIGSYALLAASLVGQTGKVYAIEPAPRNFDILERTVELNSLSPLVKTFKVGISNKTGTATFYLHERANLHSLNPTKYHQYTNQWEFAETAEIEVVGIGDFVRDHGPVDLIRMDIEGHEVEVLDGLAEVVTRYQCRPRVLFENHLPKYSDDHHSMRTPLKRLFDLGYYAKTMVSNDESKSRFGGKGYRPQTIIKTDLVYRGLYEGVSNQDAVEFICDLGSVRATLLEHRG